MTEFPLWVFYFLASRTELSMSNKQIKAQELVAAFLVTPIEVPNAKLEDHITPDDDMLYNEKTKLFYYYANGYWHPISNGDPATGDMARLISLFLISAFPQINANSSKIIEVYQALIRQFPNREQEIDYPTPFVALNDKTLNLYTNELHDHSRDHKSFHHINVLSTDLNSSTPVFDAFLETAFPLQPKMHQLIYEVIAYYLYPRSNEPATFFLYGAARTGKSTFLDLISAMIGEDFISAFSLKSLTTSQFTTAELVGKRVNILDEDESDYIKADALKALVSKRKIEACRKYQQPFSFIPQTKFLFSSNQFPKINNIDDGLKRRIHFIEFKFPIPIDRQDKQLNAKLIAEIPGIISNALIVGNAFRERNEEFSITKNMIATKNQFILELTPVLRWLDEECSVGGSDDWTDNARLYRNYKEWCDNNGHKLLNSMNFHKQLLQHPEVQSKKYMQRRGKNIRVIITINNDK